MQNISTVKENIQNIQSAFGKVKDIIKDLGINNNTSPKENMQKVSDRAHIENFEIKDKTWESILEAKERVEKRGTS
jgi:hypothetical protein